MPIFLLLLTVTVTGYEKRVYNMRALPIYLPPPSSLQDRSNTGKLTNHLPCFTLDRYLL
jgi:hypothetical protein